MKNKPQPPDPQEDSFDWTDEKSVMEYLDALDIQSEMAAAMDRYEAGLE